MRDALMFFLGVVTGFLGVAVPGFIATRVSRQAGFNAQGAATIVVLVIGILILALGR